MKITFKEELDKEVVAEALLSLLNSFIKVYHSEIDTHCGGEWAVFSLCTACKQKLHSLHYIKNLMLICFDKKVESE